MNKTYLEFLDYVMLFSSTPYKDQSVLVTEVYGTTLSVSLVERR